MKMRFGAYIFLTGALYICYQVLAQDIYSAEMMVESNVTLEAETVLGAFRPSTTFTVNTKTVEIVTSEIIAECLIVGGNTTCNCSLGYAWSNEVCYNHTCCQNTTCSENVSDIAPLCVSAVPVHINGSIYRSSWTSAETVKLVEAFKPLNALEYVNVTGQRAGTSATSSIADFEAVVNVPVQTSKLQEIVSGLEHSLTAVVFVDTLGMVTVEAPKTKVCYNSTPELMCKLEEATGSAGWNMSRTHERFELSNGIVVKLNKTCADTTYKSCIGVNLHTITGIWEGTYECGFTVGSIRHTGRAELIVALLPDVINLEISPLTVDCSDGKEKSVTVTATIPQSKESYIVSWCCNNGKSNTLQNTTEGNNLKYIFTAPIPCTDKNAGASINVTFENTRQQKRSAQVDIPVIYDDKRICKAENYWPNTPNGSTVINQTCPPGRVGYKSRTCENFEWLPMFSKCISEELNKVANAADNFLKGLGATPEVAKNIFEGLKNSSSLSSDSSNSIADVSASINILGIMAEASNQAELPEDVFPDLVTAASNMLNGTWKEVNDTIRHGMSSRYLKSVEDLVTNIKVNNSNGVNSTNLELKFCQNPECNISVFDIGVNLNKTQGILKTIAMRNIMNKLENNNPNSRPATLLLSATLENRSSTAIQIKMDFPNQNQNLSKTQCVFWNTSSNKWSTEGCNVSFSDANHTVCECNHLTPFSVLMAEGAFEDFNLDIITNVGLGVSICSLLIFLIIESLVWSAVVKTNLSHFRHTAIVNIATFLLLANSSFLASSSPDKLSETWCLVLTICKHLFYLAMFCWMLCMSVMLVHQLIFVFSPLRKRVFMFLSSILGYVCPILIVGSSYVYYKYTDKPYVDKKTCWLNFERLLVGSMHAFLLPVGTIVLSNIFSMVVVILTLVKTSVPDSSKADDKDTAKSILKVVLFLTPVFGVTWVVGFIQLMLGNDHEMFKPIAYIFTILNSFQGFFLLITGCFAEQKVREELFKLIMKNSKGYDSTKKLTSTTYTKTN